jgi:hypothetical protein
MERRRRNALYARVLAVGLGISVLVHVVLLGFGHLDFLKRSPDNKSVIVVTPPEEPTPEDSAGTVDAPWQLALELSESELAAVDQLSEYDDVLAQATSRDPMAPVVPRPRLTVHMLDSGFTPLRIPRADRITRRGGTVTTDGRGGGMGGVIIVTGGGGMGPIDDCTPSGIPGRRPRPRPVPIWPGN